MKIAAFALVVLLISSCTSTPRVANTPSGLPEIVISSSNKEAIMENIINRNALNGWDIEQQAGNFLLFSQLDVSGSFSSIMTQALIGNSYSTPPKYEARYAITNVGSGTKIVVTSAVSTQMAFGQVNKYPLKDNNAWFNAFQNQLISIKAEIEASGNAASQLDRTLPTTSIRPRIVRFMNSAEVSAENAGCSTFVTPETIETDKEIYSASCEQKGNVKIACTAEGCTLQ